MRGPSNENRKNVCFASLVEVWASLPLLLSPLIPCPNNGTLTEIACTPRAAARNPRNVGPPLLYIAGEHVVVYDAPRRRQVAALGRW